MVLQLLRSATKLALILASAYLFYPTYVQIVRAQDSTEKQNVPPRIANLPDTEEGRLTRLGWEFVNDTKKVAPQHVGNGLSCVNCHLPGADGLSAKPNALPLNVYPIFNPGGVFIAREGKKETVEVRGLVGCMERSLRGTAIDPDDELWRAFEAYIKFISPDDAKSTIGRGSPALALLERAADPVRGKEVYETFCSSCHEADGHGRPSTGSEMEMKYPSKIPPLWGPDSFGGDAGMARVRTAAAFIRQNMPFGIDTPVLSADEAYDVAAYIESQPHLQLSSGRLALDYPNIWDKPPDSPYGPRPHGDPFTEAQHKYGPWQPIMDWISANKPKPK